MDFKIIHIEETDSTNRWLQSHSTPVPVCIWADHQTAGRGCGTNSWESERGKNLTFSLLIHPEGIAANEQFRITEIVSVAMCQTLRQLLGEAHEVTVKWPNDIYVGDKKICGILIENRLQGSAIKDCIIGIGLNVNQRAFHSSAPNPVSLYQLLGQETDLAQLLEAFLQAFDREWHSKTTCFAYREMLYRKGKDGLYKTKTTSSTGEAAEPSDFAATLTGVTPEGRLVLRHQDGEEHTYAFKEIQFII